MSWFACEQRPNSDGSGARATLRPELMAEPSSRLVRSAGVFGLATMTSRVLGLVRDQVLAFYFGAGDAADAFRVAFRVPNLARDLFAEGAMSAAFVPTFTKELAKHGKPRAWRLANSVITALLIATGTLTLAGYVFADPLVRSFAAGFAEVPGKLPLTVLLARIMVPFLMLVAVAAVFMGMLNALGYFFLPALSPATFNVATIVMALFLVPVAPSLGVDPIVIVAASTLVGGLGQLALQWRPLRTEGFRYRPVLDLADPGLRQVLLLMGPGTLGMAATQINVLVNMLLASGEGTGAVTWLDFAFRLMYLPIGLFGVSIGAATTPVLSRYVAAGDLARLRSTIASALGLMLALNIPATLGLIALAHPIVSLIFERGSFTARDTAATAHALQFYAVGLAGYSVVRIVSPAFYALERSRVPVVTSAGSVVVNIALNVVLVRRFGYLGLALGTAVTALLNAAVQLWLLRRQLHGVEGRRIASTFARTLAASLAMALAAYATHASLEQMWPGTATPWRLARVTAAIGVALGVLALASNALGVQEVRDARAAIVDRLKRKRA